MNGACTNRAEEYFSRLRRAEIGIHHYVAGAYLLRYAQESSWREDNRRASNGDQVNRIAALATRCGRAGLANPLHAFPLGVVEAVLHRKGDTLHVIPGRVLDGMVEPPSPAPWWSSAPWPS
ncbi:transposase [Bradyrhizobium pachyrhizi]|uniref:transposase n=1 Tax=Bradyrhizobium pachyrhizi TaxID=280333 RepID=UPI0009E87025